MQNVAGRGSTDSGFLTIAETAQAPASDSLVERKSEFIGSACHIATLDEALSFVAQIRERHPKARHTAYAAIVGSVEGGGANERMSDDGEPSGTAGKPILDVLRAGGLTDCVVSVTRYFGGVLLGSGGLIRAYSSAASMAVKQAEILRIVPKIRYEVTLEYAWIGKFERILAQVGGVVDDRVFTDTARFSVTLPASRGERFLADVRDAFSARAQVVKV